MTDRSEGVLSELEKVQGEARQTMARASSISELEEAVKVLLGKQSVVAKVAQTLRLLPPEERRHLGEAIHRTKRVIEDQVAARRGELETLNIENQIRSETLDITLNKREFPVGKLAPVTEVTRQLLEILRPFDFELWDGPEVETDYFNFEAVNMPMGHPAREMQDTFFVTSRTVLRTHTSSVQMRAMRSRKPPLRILAPGVVYRNDYDATHTPMFHQVEALWVDKHVRLSDLKGILEYLLKGLFGDKSTIRLRPSFFPFVEPGLEVDVSCFACKAGKHCSLCKSTGWIEILGAGMVHPSLLENAGLDKTFRGFAFGLGLERVAMLQRNLPDLRELFSGRIEA